MHFSIGRGLGAVALLASAFVIGACAGEAPPSGSDTSTTPAATAIAGASAAVDQAAVWVATVPRLTIPGQSITLTAQGFGPAENLSVLVEDYGGQTVAGPISATTDLRGGLATTALQIPTGLAEGEYRVVARGEGSQREGSTALWIASAATSIELSANQLHPEEILTVDGKGFAPGERVVIYFAGRGAEPLSAVNADQAGNLRAKAVAVPVIAPGDQQIVATGATSMAQATHALRVLPFEPKVALNADALPAGESAGFFGSGFASRDTIQINLEGSTELPVTVMTDDRGRLIAPQTFTIPSDIKGPQAFSLSAARTGQKLRVTFQVVPGYPLVELSSYYGGPGSQVGLAVRGLRPRERLDLYFVYPNGSRKKLASFRADDNGWLLADSQFALPADAKSGAVTLALDGEAARTPIRVHFNVTSS